MANMEDLTPRHQQNSVVIFKDLYLAFLWPGSLQLEEEGGGRKEGRKEEDKPEQ